MENLKFPNRIQLLSYKSGRQVIIRVIIGLEIYKILINQIGNYGWDYSSYSQETFIDQRIPKWVKYAAILYSCIIIWFFSLILFSQILFNCKEKSTFFRRPIIWSFWTQLKVLWMSCSKIMRLLDQRISFLCKYFFLLSIFLHKLKYFQMKKSIF